MGDIKIDLSSMNDNGSTYTLEDNLTIGNINSYSTYFAGDGGVDTISLSDLENIELEFTGDYTTSLGRKFDGGKLEYGLIPPNALEATVEILTFGAQKYERDNWKWVPDAKRRYFDAMQRHLWAWKKGEQNDQESGRNHLAHALCCLMFLYEHDTIDFSNNEDVK